MQKQIIAVDFDGTLCTNEFPNIGTPIDRVINYIKKRKESGDIIILWTCRQGSRLDKAVEWCTARGVVFDYVNENAIKNVIIYGNDSRKIFADIYIDDKAISPCFLA